MEETERARAMMAVRACVSLQLRLTSVDSGTASKGAGSEGARRGAEAGGGRISTARPHRETGTTCMCYARIIIDLLLL